jgi:hypothetical protein
MTDPTHIADDILCLAHTNSMREWCDRAATRSFIAGRHVE